MSLEFKAEPAGEVTITFAPGELEALIKGDPVLEFIERVNAAAVAGSYFRTDSRQAVCRALCEEHTKYLLAKAIRVRAEAAEERLQTRWATPEELLGQTTPNTATHSNNTMNITTKRPIPEDGSIIWNIQPDITAYELSQLLVVETMRLSGEGLLATMRGLPESVRRHLSLPPDDWTWKKKPGFLDSFRNIRNTSRKSPLAP